LGCYESLHCEISHLLSATLTTPMQLPITLAMILRLVLAVAASHANQEIVFSTVHKLNRT